MTRYVSVIYYCDHVQAGHICKNYAYGSESTITEPAPWRATGAIAGSDEAARRIAKTDGWMFADGKHYCPAHKDAHRPPPAPRVRKPKPPPPDTLDELLEIPA